MISIRGREANGHEKFYTACMLVNFLVKEG